jgi:hypothetical protein
MKYRKNSTTQRPPDAPDWVNCAAKKKAQRFDGTAAQNNAKEPSGRSSIKDEICRCESNRRRAQKGDRLAGISVQEQRHECPAVAEHREILRRI